MRTGVSPKRIATRILIVNASCPCHPIHRPAVYFMDSRPLIQPCIRLPLQVNLHVSPLQFCALGSQQPNSNTTLTFFHFLRKEVIQPHLPIRLPCYDFTPVIMPAFGGSLLTVGSPTSGIHDSHGVTGGVYKTRERIHRDILIRDY